MGKKILAFIFMVLGVVFLCIQNAIFLLISIEYYNVPPILFLLLIMGLLLIFLAYILFSASESKKAINVQTSVKPARMPKKPKPLDTPQ